MTSTTFFSNWSILATTTSKASFIVAAIVSDGTSDSDASPRDAEDGGVLVSLPPLGAVGEGLPQRVEPTTERPVFVRASVFWLETEDCCWGQIQCTALSLRMKHSLLEQMWSADVSYRCLLPGLGSNQIPSWWSRQGCGTSMQLLSGGEYGVLRYNGPQTLRNQAPRSQSEEIGENRTAPKREKNCLGP